MTNFQTSYADLKAEQQELNNRWNRMKAEAIAYVQGVISDLKLNAEDFNWEHAEEPVKSAKERKRAYKPRPIQYRTPTGIEWTGAGYIKKEFLDYLHSQGLTEADKEKFRVQPKKITAEDIFKPELSKVEVPPTEEDKLEEGAKFEKKVKK